MRRNRSHFFDSGNKFGVDLTNCAADELAVAADRLLTGVRDGPSRPPAGPVAVTVTIGGVTAPRHTGTCRKSQPRAGCAACRARQRHGSFMPYRPNVERDVTRRDSVRATDEIVAALDERRIALAYRAGGRGGNPQGRVLRMPDARAPPRRPHRACQRNHSGGGAPPD